MTIFPATWLVGGGKQSRGGNSSLVCVRNVLTVLKNTHASGMSIGVSTDVTVFSSIRKKNKIK